MPALVLSCIWSSFSLVVCSSGHLCQPARVTQLEFSALSPKRVPSAHLPPRGFISARCPLPGPSPWRSLLSRQLLAPGLTPRPTWCTASTTASECPTVRCVPGDLPVARSLLGTSAPSPSHSRRVLVCRHSPSQTFEHPLL